jgi:23S rRNA pseudouridine1911/1915/1917 synthase
MDVALTRMLGLTRTKAAALVDAGAVTLDGMRVSKSDRLPPSGVIGVDVPEESRPPEPVADLTVVYDDEDIVVVDKPVGVAAHPSPGWTGPTVVGSLAAAGYAVSTLGAAERQGVVHRLDVGTSGLMVVAKSARAYTDLKRQFREREVDKEYHAIVQGHLDPLAGTIDAPIGRHPQSDYRFAVVSDGRPSVTHYATLEAFPHASLVDVHLETGRTHQIRVHMSAMRHPCVGDLTYGADPTLARRLGLTRQWLHATRLAFVHPGTGERVEFHSDYPPDLVTALERLRVGAPNPT